MGYQGIHNSLHIHLEVLIVEDLVEVWHGCCFDILRALQVLTKPSQLLHLGLLNIESILIDEFDTPDI